MCSHLVFVSSTDSCVFSGVCTMLCFLIPTDAVMLFCVLNIFHFPILWCHYWGNKYFFLYTVKFHFLFLYAIYNF